MIATDLPKLFGHLNIEELSVLNLGSGKYTSPISAQLAKMKFEKLVSVDICDAPVCNMSSQVHEYIKEDMLPFIASQEDNSYDVVLLFDVVEHVDMPTGAWLLGEAKRVASKRVIVWIPIGLAIQEPEPWNPWQEHKSTWHQQDLVNLGYNVIQYYPKFHTHLVGNPGAAWATYSKFPENILVVRYDCAGDVLVGTSVLPGLKHLYPHSKIDWLVSGGFDWCLRNNPNIDSVFVYDPRPNKTYDLEIELDHHYQWNKTMAEVHCRIAGVELNKPQIYLTPEEEEKGKQYAGKILVANAAGWRSRECDALYDATWGVPNLLQVDRSHRLFLAEQHHGTLREVAAIMKYADGYIGIDTVFMHMATALNVPMFLCMGPTNEKSQLVPNAMIAKPFLQINPVEPNIAFADGIPLSKEFLRTALQFRVDLETGRFRDEFVTYPGYNEITYVHEDDYPFGEYTE